jgi:hypothetical protein
LALALVADVVAQGAGPFQPTESPDLVSTLVGSLVDTVPSPRHLSALEACAQVLTTTEPRLAELLGTHDAHAMFVWLRGLSIVESGPRGLFPHDLARNALGVELRSESVKSNETVAVSLSGRIRATCSPMPKSSNAWATTSRAPSASLRERCRAP